jgi:glucokinase
MAFVVGVDLGGTNVRAQAVAADGSLQGPLVSRPSFGQDGQQRTLAALSQAVEQACEGRKPEAIGIALPGHVDDAAGRVIWAPNFAETRDGVAYGWRNVNVRSALSAQFGCPVLLGNDANCAALGEYRFGAGENKAQCLVLLTVGTGVGGGVVLGPGSVMGAATGPLLLLGGGKMGGELGHVLIRQGGLDCNAGSYGALEAYCRRDAIIQRARHRIQRGRKTALWDMVEGDLSRLTPKLLTEAADAGDAVAIDIWREVGVALGAGIGSLMNVFAPDVFAIGGQISGAGEWLLEPARLEARYIALPQAFEACRIVAAQRVDDAGLLGGAAAAWAALEA